MYRVKDAATGGLIEEAICPIFVRQQELVDFPIACDSLDEADGLFLSDDQTLVGIAGKRMGNYKPNVTVEEFNGEAYLFERVQKLQDELNHAKEERQAIKDDNLALMMGVADLYAAVTSTNGGAV